MAYYFTPFPYVQYDPEGLGVPQLCMDITRRFRLQETTRNSKLLFYEYEIKDRDRPDVMADKYYGNPRLDWLFFIVNSMHDPYYSWPLNQFQFEEFIKQKYGSIAAAMATNHHYEQIVTTRKEYYSDFQGSQVVIPEKVVIVDYTTYASLGTAERREVDCFTWEENENNKRRLIKIIDKAYVPGLLRDFRRIFET